MVVSLLVGAIVVAFVAVVIDVGVAVADSLVGKPKKLSHIAQQPQTTSSQSMETIVKLLIAQTSPGTEPVKSFPSKLSCRRLTRFPISRDKCPENRLNSSSKSVNSSAAQSSSGSLPAKRFACKSRR